MSQVIKCPKCSFTETINVDGPLEVLCSCGKIFSTSYSEKRMTILRILGSPAVLKQCGNCDFSDTEASQYPKTVVYCTYSKSFYSGQQMERGSVCSQWSGE